MHLLGRADGFDQATGTIIIAALNILGGTEGMSGLTSFPSRWVEIYLAIGVLLIILFGVRRLVSEDVGLVLRAIKDNDQSVRA